ncbi:MAG: hypothetical protein OEM62_09115 [Acidobacteriota bacterium]|nr:hypothetical protein [Acidobacteriota bacterium]
MKRMILSTMAVLLMVAATGIPASAEEVTRTYEFAVDEWREIQATDGPVTLHRIRLDRKEDRFNKSALARPYNQEYLEPIRFQLEYSNGSTGKWRARVTVRWLDEDGEIIDGFSANETLGKKSAQKVTQASVSTLKYGLAKAKTLEVEIRFEP